MTGWSGKWNISDINNIFVFEDKIQATVHVYYSIDVLQLKKKWIDKRQTKYKGVWR